MWLWLHGFTGSPRSFDALAARATLDSEPLVPWLLGHGRDWQRREVGSFDDEISRLASIAADQPRPRLLCGYSLGARLALGLLAAHPGHFDAAVLIGVQPGLTGGDARAARRRDDARLARMLRTDGLDAFVQHWESLPLFASQRELPRKTLDRQREIRLGHDAEGLARSLEVLGLAEMRDLRPSIGTLGLPLTLVTGSEDAKFKPLAHTLVAKHPHVNVEIIDGVGHNAVLEAPDAIAAVLDRTALRVDA